MFMTIDFRDLDNAFTFNNTMRRDLLNIEFSKFIQNFRTLNVFGKFLLIVNPSTATDMDGTLHTDL